MYYSYYNENNLYRTYYSIYFCQENPTLNRHFTNTHSRNKWFVLFLRLDKNSLQCLEKSHAILEKHQEIVLNLIAYHKFTSR